MGAVVGCVELPSGSTPIAIASLGILRLDEGDQILVREELTLFLSLIRELIIRERGRAGSYLPSAFSAVLRSHPEIPGRSDPVGRRNRFAAERTFER